jgi:hypothetical protein
VWADTLCRSLGDTREKSRSQWRVTLSRDLRFSQGPLILSVLPQKRNWSWIRPTFPLPWQTFLIGWQVPNNFDSLCYTWNKGSEIKSDRLLVHLSLQRW